MKDGLREEGAAQGSGDGDMTGRLLNKKGQWEVDEGGWGVLELVYPKPDLLIVGTGPSVIPLAPAVRRYLNDLGIRLEVQDTRNAAAQFNLLATERGVGQVAAALIPIGWKETK
jgi:NADH dehydrogenase [ubiquinone] 1 alpha subcomplex assembly factor 3